ncbi:MAG: CopD family protein [Acetobacteraceae bacterium]|nr:CopD family protein [Acetobacteraceae bacterium]
MPGLLGTAYGHAVLLKAALFTVLLGFAALNRVVLTPRLRQAQAASATGRGRQPCRSGRCR